MISVFLIKTDPLKYAQLKKENKAKPTISSDPHNANINKMPIKVIRLHQQNNNQRNELDKLQRFITSHNFELSNVCEVMLIHAACSQRAATRQ